MPYGVQGKQSVPLHNNDSTVFMNRQLVSVLIIAPAYFIEWFCPPMSVGMPQNQRCRWRILPLWNERVTFTGLVYLLDYPREVNEKYVWVSHFTYLCWLIKSDRTPSPIQTTTTTKSRLFERRDWSRKSKCNYHVSSSIHLARASRWQSPILIAYSNYTVLLFH